MPIVGTAGGVCGSIVINSGASVTLAAANTLQVHGNVTNNGTFVANSGTLQVYRDFASNGNFEANYGTTVFAGFTAAKVSGASSTVFHNLTISNTGGVTAEQDITVNGVLHLQAANPLATKGGLHTSGSATLYMGPLSTTIGIGDVSGRIKRTNLEANTTYTFGSQYTTLTFTGGSGTELPDEILFIARIGEAHNTKSTAIARYYEIIRSGSRKGSSPTRFNLTLRYLDSEMNGNNENNLVFWDHHVPYAAPSPHEHGQSALNTTDNFITLASHGIGYLVQNEYSGEIVYINDGDTPQNQSKIWMIAERIAPTGNNVFIWQGANSTDWDYDNNWLNDGGHRSPKTAAQNEVPASTHLIYIQKGQYNPVLPANDVRVAKLFIENEGVLTANGIYNLTADYIRIYEGGIYHAGNSNIEVLGALNINDGDVSWNNLGTFNPGGSTVKFMNADGAISGTTDFYNVEIGGGHKLSMIAGTVMGIKNEMNVTGTWNTTFFGETTVEYKGGGQTVVLPEGSAYHNLTLSGTGVKTLPASHLTMLGNFSLSGTAATTAVASLAVDGHFTLESGTGFLAGNFTHFLKGDFINNNSTFNSGTSTFILNGTSTQTIGGTASTTFTNLTMNNPAGVTLGLSQSVTGTLDLTNGILTTGSSTLTVGTFTPVCSEGSIVNASALSYVNGKLARIYCGIGSKTFPIGKGGNYRSLSLAYTALTGTSTVTAEQFETFNTRNHSGGYRLPGRALLVGYPDRGK
jgi:hypothetical protein